ncbi:MAG TPA: HD domain-containing phosphohydrolase [Actinomycetota bacterium]|nr:HD domain-containing phosphohydrolase [Actinomycetota bacterium]
MSTTRVLLIGGDASMWIGLSSTLGGSSSQIFVPKETDVESIRAAAAQVDVVIVVLNGDDDDPHQPLHVIAAAGLQKRTIVMAEPDDQRAAAEAVLIGVAGFVQQGCDPKQLASAIHQVAAQGVLYDSSGAAELHARMELSHSGSSNIAAAKALASALELKDTYTGGHAERVTQMAMRLARAAMLEGALPSEALEAAFLLHDVGKIGIPESILNKPGGLTDTERRVLQTHPILGEKVVAPLGFPACVREVIRHHHERWDGHGYPDGLGGREIPAAARLFSIADVIDAMTSVRPYRKPVSFRAAIEEVMNNAGAQFDPDLCGLVPDTFLGTQEELRTPFTS